MSLFSPPSDYLLQAQPVWRIGQLTCAINVSKRRRSIGFKVQNGVITLQVPYGLSKRTLTEVVSARLDWLAAKQAAQLALPEPPMRKLQTGELWPLFDQQLVLSVRVTKRHYIEVKDTQLIMAVTSRQTSKACQLRLLESWYKDQARAFAERRVTYWQQVMNADLCRPPARIEVRRFRSRWGSCNANGVLKFNYLLALAPEYVFDYVVVHEMCHLRYMHHGREFWQMVSRYCPDYRSAKQWLQAHAGNLVLNLAA
ncbi:MAG: SprT family zinc-dependent metalloprotease [Gammaproteobacteria bacterium]|jgi:hypothetical protein|nr:SprT family zinc-dependent metalloprotease [Gammaproteobacteria bacterium]